MTKGWLTYPRIVVLLMGLVFAGILAWMLPGWLQGTEPKRWWEAVFMLLLAVWAVSLLFVGLLGNNRMVDQWADWSTSHEASLVVVIVAAPIYWLLKKVAGKR